MDRRHEYIETAELLLNKASDYETDFDNAKYFVERAKVYALLALAITPEPARSQSLECGYP